MDRDSGDPLQNPLDWQNGVRRVVVLAGWGKYAEPQFILPVRRTAAAMTTLTGGPFRMRWRNTLTLGMLVVALAVGAGSSLALLKTDSIGSGMTRAADQFLSKLTDEQRAIALVADYNAAQRLEWHFIPKPTRKGLQLRDMTAEQRQAAAALLRAALSQVGYDKSSQIMELETILHIVENKRGTNRFARDPLRYYVTVFGKPSAEGRWGLSFEGHHLSLNFVVDKQQVISSTPTFLGSNPAVVKDAVEGGAPVGTRVLAKEELLAFELLGSLNDEQRKEAIIAAEAPSDIRAAGDAQPPQTPAAGIAYAKLNTAQQALLHQLIVVYADNVPAELRDQRLAAIEAAGRDSIHFAWAGASKPGVGHYYRIQGPSFLIELVNTQPDPAGNPANHIHSVWRDMKGDFALPVAAGG